MTSQQALVSAFIDACNWRDCETISAVCTDKVATKVLVVLLKLDRHCQNHQIQITDWFAEPAEVCCWLVFGEEACGDGSTIVPAGNRRSGLALFRISEGKIVALDWFLDALDKVLPCAASS